METNLHLRLNNLSNIQFRIDFQYIKAQCEQEKSKSGAADELDDDTIWGEKYRLATSRLEKEVGNWELVPLNDFDSSSLDLNRSIAQDIRFADSEPQVEDLAISQRRMWKRVSGALEVGEELNRYGFRLAWAEVPKDFDYVLGFSAMQEDGNILIAVNCNTGNTRERLRFSFVYLMSRQVLRFSSDMNETKKNRYTNRFTGALLLPSQELIDNYLNDVKRITEHIESEQAQVDALEPIFDRAHAKYGVSVASVINRFCHAANLISRDLQKACHAKIIKVDPTERKYSPTIANVKELKLWKI